MANDFPELSAMIYSGRGITLGITPEGDSFVGYTLTGRSPSSQARELIRGEKTGIIRTELIEDDDTLIKMFSIKSPEELAKLKADIAKGSRALIVYPAIMPVGNRLVVSNGAQTKLLYDTALDSEVIFPESIVRSAMRNSKTEYDEKDDKLIDITAFEPDSPNFTPRISGCIDRNGRYAFHIVKKKGEEKDPDVFWYGPQPGVCHTLTTYSGGNEKPLHGFVGNPLEGRVETSSAGDICESLYTAIGNPNPSDNNKIYRVATAVIVMKPVGLETAIFNVADPFRAIGLRKYFEERK